MEEKVTLEVTKEELSILSMGTYLFLGFIEEKIKENKGTDIEKYSREQKEMAKKLRVQIKEARGDKDA